MASPITPINTVIPPIDALSLTQAPASGGDFQNILKAAVQQVESSRSSADASIQGFLAGENGEMHSTILAAQKAELQFDLFMQVRNRVISAYQEIMRMQV